MAPHLLAQVEVNYANGLLGVVIFVVLQHVGVAGQTATAKNKPPLLPCLQGKHTNKGGGLFCVFPTMTAPFPTDRSQAKCVIFPF